ncbi:hypothetical protein NDU88_005786 [Pleurodeles waltl]|uniref:Uncharacterized protein n=1 Tax=Pleurodeles waltl TaxID=8319 RepID=A0AAV7QLN8_PLEWA|nr:hypothetical protein NDU88_005786 [Pleurodeles waltl]
MARAQCGGAARVSGNRDVPPVSGRRECSCATRLLIQRGIPIYILLGSGSTTPMIFPSPWRQPRCSSPPHLPLVWCFVFLSLPGSALGRGVLASGAAACGCTLAAIRQWLARAEGAWCKSRALRSSLLRGYLRL